MNKEEFVKPDEKLKDNPWYLICFGYILLGMVMNGKNEVVNASEVNRLLNHLIREARDSKKK